jgi:hypothetical protein
MIRCYSGGLFQQYRPISDISGAEYRTAFLTCEADKSPLSALTQGSAGAGVLAARLPNDMRLFQVRIP